MSSTRCCNDCPIPLEGEPVDEVHIRTEDIPEFMRDNLAAATLDLIHSILRQPGGREAGRRWTRGLPPGTRPKP